MAPKKENPSPPAPKPYINPYLGGFLLGIVLFLSFILTGSGLGASGGVNRIWVWIEDLIAPRHVDMNPYLAKMAGGDRNPLLNWTVFVLVGATLGGALSAKLHNRWKVETHMGPRLTSVRLRWALAFIGGLIMGYGARFARGCTSGQALSGGAVLSVGSWVVMFGIFGAAYALAYFVRRLWT